MSDIERKVITDYIDTLEQDWQRSSFVERLDQVRSLIADEGYPEGAEEAIEAYLSLEPSERSNVTSFLRIRNQLFEWARNFGNTSIIQSLAEDLMNVTPSTQSSESQDSGEMDPNAYV